MAKGTKKDGGKAKRIEALSHKGDKRQNIPTAETQSYMAEEEAKPKPQRYKRNPDLDPQLVWRGKDEQDGAPLSVDTVPIYIQEKIHPKAIIEDLKRLKTADGEPQADLFSDFNGIAVEDKLDFYRHALNWSNRMILGDALLVMNSLAEKENLRGRIQMIYMDPPYGIKFGSNWQVSTKARNIKDGRIEDTSREPEVVKAFRDTWELGVHSYLAYLRDRFSLSRELLTESGSIFVQIGDENVHLVRSLLDEVFGSANFCAQIAFRKTGASTDALLASGSDHLLWFARSRGSVKYRQIFKTRALGDDGTEEYIFVELPDGSTRDATLTELSGIDPLPPGARAFRPTTMTSSHHYSLGEGPHTFQGRKFLPGARYWSTHPDGRRRCGFAQRLIPRKQELAYRRYLEDFPVLPLTTAWPDTMMSSRGEEKIYVVQSSAKVVARALAMTTDAGDLVLDPTCGSGTTAYVAEQWGRRWITIDTSRVALALARTRLMAARFPYYILADTVEGLRKEGEVAGKAVPERETFGDIRKGFVYERVPHVTLKAIANNAEIDVIYEKWQRTLEPIRAEINKLCGTEWEEWEVPRKLDDTPPPTTSRKGRGNSEEAEKVLAQWWEARTQRQKEIDASIARAADIEYLYDRPYEEKSIVRVTGPFTVESLSPHRVLPTDEDDEALLDALDEEARDRGETPPPRRKRAVNLGEDDFVRVVLENLKVSGVQNTKKKERLTFSEVKPWPGGKYLHAEGRYEEAGKERRAAVCIGPEYGTVSYQLVREAAREAKDLFDVLVVCGFAFEPNVSDETMSLGRLIVLKARMNQDLHMAEHLKKTGAGNLFVVFGEPDIDVRKLKDGQCEVEIKGVDVFDPTTGEVRPGGVDDIACWFIDTDYDEESFFVRHAYFLGARDPYERLKRTLKAEIDESAWATLYKSTSRAFPKPTRGKIAVKVINHYGDEVLKVYSV